MKKIIILGIALFLLAGCQRYSGGEPDETEEPKQEEVKKEKPKTLKEKVTSAIYNSMEKETFKGAVRIVSVDIVKLDEEEKSVVNIVLNADERGSVERAKRDMLENAKNLFPILFKTDKIIEASVIWQLPLVDAKGSEDPTKVMQIRIKKENEINWDNFDYNNFEIVADQYYEHDSLKVE